MADARQAAKYLGVAQSTIRKWSDTAASRPSTRPAATGATGAPTSTRSSSAPARAAASRAGPLILIVDDDDGVREYVRANLELEGYTVREAAARTRASRRSSEQSPDLILLDVMMPRVDGWEMLRRVQERHGVGAIPVIMFSGKVDEASATSASARGAPGVHRQAVRPAAADRVGEADAADTCARSSRLELERWVVDHRRRRARPIFVGLSFAGSLGPDGWIRLARCVLARAATALPALSTLVSGRGRRLARAALKLRRAIGRARTGAPRADPLGTRRSTSRSLGHTRRRLRVRRALARYRTAPGSRRVLFVLAGAIAWSRVYVGVHYPLDIVAGALLGVGVGLQLFGCSQQPCDDHRQSRPPG